jgi:hypothetical protein
MRIIPEHERIRSVTLAGVCRDAARLVATQRVGHQRRRTARSVGVRTASTFQKSHDLVGAKRRPLHARVGRQLGARRNLPGKCVVAESCHYSASSHNDSARTVQEMISPTLGMASPISRAVNPKAISSTTTSMMNRFVGSLSSAIALTVATNA